MAVSDITDDFTFNTFGIDGTKEEFTPSDRLIGWDSVGTNPPTAAQFSQLQYENDVRQKLLYDQFVELQGETGADMVGIGGGRTQSDKNAEFVSVKDFSHLAVNTAEYLDWYPAIQAAINSITNTTFDTTWVSGSPVYTKGGGEVRLPPGEYNLSQGLLLGQHVRLVGSSTVGYNYPLESSGSVLVARFSNPNQWVISTANYNISGELPDFRGNITGANIDAGERNSTHGCEVERIYIKTYAGTYAYGGIRLLGSPNSKISRVNVYGTDVGFLINASWGVSVRDVSSQTYLYGFVGMVDVNGLSINGYFDGLAGETITDLNRLTGLYPDDFNSAIGLPDWRYNRFGLLCYYCNAVNVDTGITEGWDVARAFVQSDGVSDNAPYMERNSLALIGVAASRVNLYGGFEYNPAITNKYYFGQSVDSVLSCMPPGVITANPGSTPNSIVVNSNDPDASGWKYSDFVSFQTVKVGTIRVSSTGSADNIADTTTYTTLNEAFRRISISKIKDWVIVIKDGDAIELSTSYNLNSKNVTIKKEGGGSNPTLTVLSASGYPAKITVGDCSISFDGVNIQYSTASSPTDGFDRAGIVFSSGNNNIAFSNLSINCGNGWCVLQQEYDVSCNISSAFKSCSISGSGSSVVLSSAYANTGKSTVINIVHSTTISASMITIGNGWLNSTVISSNFV